MLLEREVARALAESSTPEQAAPRILEAICKTAKWEVGLIWSFDRSAGMLRLLDSWHNGSPTAAGFAELNAQVSLTPGEGLPGRVWSSGQPEWVGDMRTEQDPSRSEAAVAAGLQSVLGLPIPREGGLVGVMELFARRRVRQRADLVRAIEEVCSQVGRFMGRKEIEDVVLDSEAMKTAIVESALDAIIAMDDRGNVTEFNPAAEEIFGYRRADAVGRPLAELIIPPLLRKRHRAGLDRFLATGEGPLLGRRLELLAMRAGGSELPVELTITVIRRADRPPQFIGFIRDLTDRKRAEHELRRTQELNTLILNNTQDLISLVDPTGHIVYASPSHQRVMGFSAGELEGRSVFDLVHPDDAALVAAGIAESVSSGHGGHVSEIRFRHKDGHWVTLEGLGRIIAREGEAPILLGTARDVTERKLAEEGLRRLAAIVESSDDAIFSKTLDGIVLTWNPGAERLYGYSAEEMIGRSVAVLVPADRPLEVPEMLERLRNGEQIQHFETVRLRKDGSLVDVSLSVSPIVDRSGRVIASCAIARDITDRRRAEEQTAFLAYHDRLTGLANRVRFEELLAMALTRGRRHGLGIGVLYVDLDDFKLVNDRLGHAAGDDLLRQVAERLVLSSRDTDTVARLGGDEFMVMVADLVRRAGREPSVDPDTAVLVVETVAARIHEALKAPFVTGGSQVFVTASIGVSLFPLDADDARTLLKNADAAMYESKAGGKGRSMLYAALAGEQKSQLSVINRLRRAVAEEQWVLRYQPIVDLGSRAITGVEAVLSWDDPDRGSVPAQEFLPLVEDIGLIEPVGDWLFAQMFRHARAWADHGISLDVMFHLSPRQLWQRDLADRLLGQLDASGVDPRSVVVEVTEAAAMTDPERTRHVLVSLARGGVRIAIDDFGTGYSSLSRLKELPVDVLKIDPSFVHDLANHQTGATLVKALIRLARSLSMTPIAKGIDDEEESAFLWEQGCHLGQGPYFGHPVAAEEIPGLHERGPARLPAA